MEVLLIRIRKVWLKVIALKNLKNIEARDRILFSNNYCVFIFNINTFLCFKNGELCFVSTI